MPVGKPRRSPCHFPILKNSSFLPKSRLEEKFKATEKAGIRLDLRHKDEPKKKSQDLER